LTDLDAVARLAETDAREAVRALETGMVARSTAIYDWPDALAASLRQDPSTRLDLWAAENGLHPGSLGRGFASVFGISAGGYRLVQRVQHAINLLVCKAWPLSEIAAESGFSDQSHMSRSIWRLTGTTPAALKRSLARDALGSA
jgi:AraC-like DNA-binding protein